MFLRLSIPTVRRCHLLVAIFPPLPIFPFSCAHRSHYRPVPIDRLSRRPLPWFVVILQLSYVSFFCISFTPFHLILFYLFVLSRPSLVLCWLHLTPYWSSACVRSRARRGARVGRVPDHPCPGRGPCRAAILLRASDLVMRVLILVS